MSLPKTVAETAALLASQGYIADHELSTTVHLALALHRPLLLEGEPGTGKTEIAKVLAEGLGRRLVRLQCYDGMDLATIMKMIPEQPFGLPRVATIGILIYIPIFILIFKSYVFG